MDKNPVLGDLGQELNCFMYLHGVFFLIYFLFFGQSI